MFACSSCSGCCTWRINGSFFAVADSEVLLESGSSTRGSDSGSASAPGDLDLEVLLDSACSTCGDPCCSFAGELTFVLVSGVQRRLTSGEVR